MTDKHQPPSHDDETWDSDTPWQEPGHQQFGPSAWPGQYQGQRQIPQTYMTAAILVTLFCFLPTGIAAIVFSSQVSAKGNAGDFEGAAESSRKARLWVIVSLAVGVFAWIAIIIVGASTSTTTEYMPAP